MSEEITRCIYTDGASRGNPGPSAYAFMIMSGNIIIRKVSGFIERATNNVAEYTAVIKALEEASSRGLKNVKVYSDSQLIISQINGQYKVKQPHLQQMHAIVQKLKTKFDEIQFINISRDNVYIHESDMLCNACLDNYQVAE